MRIYLVPTLALISACNKAPEGLVVTIGPEAAKTTDTLDLDVVTAATDPNKRDQVGMSVTWFKDDVEQPDLADAWAVPPSRTQKGQEWTASVIATDSVLSAEPAEYSITIENTLPTLALSISSKAPKTDADLVASTTTTDADGDVVEVGYTWTVDGVATDITDDTVLADATGKGQVWEVTAVPFDGEEIGAGQSVDTTIRNTVPSVLAARITPTAVHEDTVANCVGAAWSDPDPEDPETYEVTWRVNGAVVSTDPTLEGTFFDRDDSVSCELTPVDNESAGPKVASAASTVNNTGPMVLGAGIDPAEPTTTDDIVAVTTGYEDIDGDAAVFLYAWFVDGVEVSTASFIRSDMFEKGSDVYVRIRGYDGIDLGTPRYGSATIANSPPSAPTITLPGSVVESEDLLCRVTAASTDADDDIIDYTMTWTVDGTAYTGGVFTTTWPGDTVPSSDTVSGETWECTATPHDGDDPGAVATASTVIDPT